MSPADPAPARPSTARSIRRFLGGSAGSWYGIQGTDWTNPPLFRNADVAYRGGRRHLLVGGGHHIGDISWIDGSAMYRITNTIFDGLTNEQMLALAQSAQAID